MRMRKYSCFSFFYCTTERKKKLRFFDFVTRPRFYSPQEKKNWSFWKIAIVQRRNYYIFCFSLNSSEHRNSLNSRHLDMENVLKEPRIRNINLWLGHLNGVTIYITFIQIFDLKFRPISLIFQRLRSFVGVSEIECVESVSSSRPPHSSL